MENKLRVVSKIKDNGSEISHSLLKQKEEIKYQEHLITTYDRLDINLLRRFFENDTHTLKLLYGDVRAGGFTLGIETLRKRCNRLCERELIIRVPKTSPAIYEIRERARGLIKKIIRDWAMFVATSKVMLDEDETGKEK